MSQILIPAAPTQFTTTQSGDISDLDFQDADLILFNNVNAGGSVTGLKAGKPGQKVALLSQFRNINLDSERPESQPPNRLRLPFWAASMTFSAPLTSQDSGGSATFIYDGTINRWRLLEFEQGAWIPRYSGLLVRTRGDPQPAFANQVTWYKNSHSSIAYLYRAGGILSSPGLGIWWWSMIASGRPGGIAYLQLPGVGTPPFQRTFVVQSTLGGGSPSDPFVLNFEGVYLTDTRTGEIVDSNYIAALNNTFFTLEFEYKAETSFGT